MAKNNFIPLVGGGTQMPASAEAVAADILRLDGAVSDLAEDVGTIENWDAGDIPYDSSENYNDGTVGGSLNDLKSAIGENGANILSAYPTDTASGAIASFSDGAALPVKALTVDIEPVQSGSGDPAPDNVRPIAGWTEVKIWRDATHDTTGNPALTIDLDGTVYGGTLDVLTGVLTVDRAYFSPSAVASLAGTNDADCKRARIDTPYSVDYGEASVVNAKLVCNKYKTETANRTYLRNTGISDANVNSYVYIYDPELQTKEAWNASLADNAVQIVYPLAAPQTVRLDPETLSTLLGENNIWADAGDVSVTYRADPSLYVDKKVSAAEQIMELIITANREDSMTATKAYVSGDLIITGGKLYKATTSIANGAALTVNTNVSQTTVAAEIAAVS